MQAVVALVGLAVCDEPSQAPDHVAHPLDLLAGAPQGVFDRREALVRSAAEHPPRCCEVDGRRRQRLVELVRQRAGHSADRGQTLRRKLVHADFEIAPLGEVPHEADEDQLAVDDSLDNRQIDRERLAVLAPSLDLPADADDLSDAGAQVLGDVSVVASGVARRHQHPDVASHHLAALVSEDLHAGGVDGLNGAGDVDRDDGVLRAVEDRAELRHRAGRDLLGASCARSRPRRV